MPRRKQSNPQPVKLDSEDAIAVGNSDSLVLESDFFLGQDLEFGENDYHRIIGFERDSDSIAADMGIPAYALSDEDCSSYNRLSMESDLEDPRDTESEREEIAADAALAPYLSCMQCGQLLGDPLNGPLDLTELYCLRCGQGAESEALERDDAQGEESEPAAHPPAKEDRRRAPAHDSSPSRAYSCNLCSFSSRYSNHLKRHMKTHNGEKPYRCQHCAYASAQLVNLQRHMRTHTGEKPYKCDYCTFACNSLGNLKRHQRMHTQEKVNRCSQCDYSASSTITLKRHMKGHKKDSSAALAEDLTLCISSDPDFLHAYGSLSTDTHSPGLLDAEALGPETEPLPELLFPFACPMCGLEPGDEDCVAGKVCSKCALDDLSKSPLLGSERGDKLYSCTACPFITQYPNHLPRHMKTHSGEKPYKCPLCEYASAHFDNLKRHHRVHTGEKPYKCHLCEYACGNLANLKRHQRIHSGAKPFQCTVCSYSCNQSMNLKRHMLRHTGEKPFKCQECAYTTGHWDNYKRHQKKHGHSTEGWIKVQLPERENEEEEGEM